MEVIATTEQRKSKRFSTPMSAVVKAKESETNFWKEETEVISISRTGAGFYIRQECQIGQLLSVLIAMPQHLRCYDEDKDLYRIWGLVQHCNRAFFENFSGYHVGVAFIGKNAPVSYNTNPLQTYRIYGMNNRGLWNVIETGTPFIPRKYPRFWTTLEVTLEIFDSEKNSVAVEETTTENISLRGAAVFSKLDINVGNSIKFTSKEHKFSTLAVVRNRQIGRDKLSRLNLEFIENEFPIGATVLPTEEEENEK